MNGFWWCARCNEEVGPGRVTFQERHEDCGNGLEWMEDVTVVDLLARLEAAESSLKAANERVKELTETNLDNEDEIRSLIAQKGVLVQQLARVNEATALDIDALSNQVKSLTVQLEAAQEVRQRLSQEVAEYGDRACKAERELKEYKADHDCDSCDCGTCPVQKQLEERTSERDRLIAVLRGIGDTATQNPWAVARDALGEQAEVQG